ncbi:MAG: exodeoxyribonuclease III [Myxococcota bacterium]
MVRLTSWNVNGIRAVHKRGDLDWLWSSDSDIILLQETKCSVDQVPPELMPPPGFQAAYCAGERKGYSGVATFWREGLSCDVVGRGFGEERFDNEGRILITDHGAFVLLNIYFPNGGSGEPRLRYKMDFYAAFHAYVDRLRAEGREVVVGGDYNTAHRDIDLALPEKWGHLSGALPEERQVFQALLDGGFVDTFRAEHGDRPGAYTFWETRVRARKDNLGWRIDYFLITEGLEETLGDAWISPHILGSDHCPVGVELDVDLGP